MLRGHWHFAVLRLLWAVAVAGCPAAAWSADLAKPSFKSEPRVTVDGDSVRITFSVTRPTDVAVSIRKDGYVVRHLAAGVLGKTPPAPLKPSLRQSLVWDGKDDAGRLVDPTGCKVRVCLGLEPTFDRILGWKGEAIGEAIPGLAVDEKGHLYVLNSGGKKPTRIYVLNRQGKYLKTILPYPGNLPYEKVKVLPHLKLHGGQTVPVIRQPVCFTCYPDMDGVGGPGQFNLPQQTMTTVADQLVMSNPWAGRAPSRVTNRRLLIINKDGSIPENYLGPFLARGKASGRVRLAAAADRKTVFATGLAGKGGKPLHAIYQVGLDEKGPAKLYLGQADQAGSDEKHFDTPRGLAVDRFGNLYVSDWGNNRIAAFAPDGRFLGQVAVDQPGQLAVHQRTCALYVMKVGKSELTPSAVRKLAPLVSADGKWAGRGEQQGALKLRYGDSTLAVDGTAEPTVIWIGHRFGTPSLFRVEEKQGRFSKPKPTVPKDDPSLLIGGFLAVDGRREEVYSQVHAGPASWESWPGTYKSASRWVRINGRTGSISRVKIAGTEVAVGPEGYLYVHCRGQLARFDRDGKAAPFPSTGTNVLTRSSRRKNGNIEVDSPFALLHGPSGHCVGPDGKVYVMYPHISGTYKADCSVVDVYGPDGKIRKKALVRCGPDAEGIQVDARGNIYVADNIKPRTAVYPPELAGLIPKTRTWTHGVNWYGWYGSVLKFPPTGGTAWGPTGTPHTSSWGEARFTVKVDGARWVHAGIYPMPGGSVWLGCSCFGPRFGVDGFGRTFMPDVATFSVRVIDTNGNPIIRFGGYGNMDAQGPQSAIPTPAIAFAWPQYVAVSEEAAYIADVINRRIVRVKLNYAVEKMAAIE